MVTVDGKPRARYRFGFFARYLRTFVLAKMDAEGWRQYEVAAWLDIPTHALSEYLNRHTHPSSERRRKLLQLGCRESELSRAEFADKLDWWMTSHGLGPEDVVASLDSIQRYEREMRFARASVTPIGDLTARSVEPAQPQPPERAEVARDSDREPEAAFSAAGWDTPYRESGR